MERTKLNQIEKKMEMSLDDIIKQNRSKPPSAGVNKGLTKAKAPARAPLQMNKASKKATKAQAPKVLVAKQGVAGKRQAIQQKKAASKVLAGVRVKATLGGVAKPIGSVKRVGGGVGHTQALAQKIVGRARNLKQQQAPKQLGRARAVPKAQQAPKQLVASKQARKQIQFNGTSKSIQSKQQQQKSAPKSLAQSMNQRRRGGGGMPQGQRPGQMKKQAPARAPLVTGSRKRGGGGPAPMQLDRTMAGSVRKRAPQQRAPIFQGPGNQRQVAAWPPQQQQEVRRQPLAPIMTMRRGPAPRGQFAPAASFRQLQPVATNPAAVARQQAVLHALRLQQLEDAKQRAERNAFIHQSMQMMSTSSRPAAHQMAPAAARAPTMARMGGAGLQMMGGRGYENRGGYDGYDIRGGYDSRAYEQPRGLQQQQQRRYSGYA